MTIGFIGLGIMGRPMAANLMKAGFQLVVYDVARDRLTDALANGAQPGTSPADVAGRSEVVITMLPNSPHVREVALGPRGIVEGARRGSILIDMSSIAPATAREVAASLAVKGVEMLDAPVSGGEPKAVDGTLAIMVGGEARVFEQVKGIFLKMGSSAVYCGGIGSGNVTKIANQIIVALNIAAMSEALVLATKAGVNPETVFNAIKGGLAGSTVLNAKAPMVLDGNFKPGFRIELHIKDLQNALDTAHELGVPIPLTGQVMEFMQALKIDGKAGQDHSGIVQFYERLAGVEARR
ncbi:MAG TPA: 2-hydroxy-3-oxopropionate reductase [Desulfobacterales bacterium]|nr:2-hydroxy-3-oxopropionate reductase [Desulfobacterales bacterium]